LNNLLFAIGPKDSHNKSCCAGRPPRRSRPKEKSCSAGKPPWLRRLTEILWKFV